MKSPSLSALCDLLLHQLARGEEAAARPAAEAAAAKGESPDGRPPDEREAFSKALQIIQHAGTGSADGSSAAPDLRAEVVLEDAIGPGDALPAYQGEPAHVLLSGGTGFLGAFLLEGLLRRTGAVVHCLVRAGGAAEGMRRLQENLKSYALWDESFRGRVIAVPGDLEKRQFGLDAGAYRDLAGRIDAVYHGAAGVHWVSPYETLRGANVEGTREVLRLAFTLRRKQLHYVSSLGVFSLKDHLEHRLIAEETAPRHCDALYLGYMQSKWVAEQLVFLARSRGLPVCVYRPWFVMGHSRTGAGSLNDAISRTVVACIQMGAAPDMDVAVGMTPVDYVTGAIVHLSRRPDAAGKVFHLFNPSQVPWGHLVDWLCACGYPLRRLPYHQWRRELGARSRGEPDNTLGAMAPLFVELPRDESLAIPELHFDCRNALEGLAGSGIECPTTDARLLETYLTYCTHKGILEAPRTVAAQ
jgi:thioester reductase-like protein